MIGLLSTLSGLGLEELANVSIYEEDGKAEQEEMAVREVKKDKAVKPQAKGASQIPEKEMVFDKSCQCPICGGRFTTKVMKSGKARPLPADWDLRPRYEGIDSVKYDVIHCPHCGYTALSRYFATMTPVQAKLIKENISEKIKLKAYAGEVYTHEESLEKYQLCLANAVVKRAKASEKAFICLKLAWLTRGYQESEEGADRLEELQEMEEQYLWNAYNGFEKALQSENLPICGMDEMTINYLLAELATHFEKYDVASKLVGTILTSTSATSRLKDKTRDLKEQIIEGLKNK